MKKSLLTFFLIIPFVCSVNLWADRAGYTITNYSFDGVYHSNNTVTVKETISVNFYEPRHGIYHTIPQFVYINVSPDENYPIVKKYYTKIKNYSATGDKCSTETSDGNFVFKIGDKNREITGNKTYEFKYTYVFPDDRYSDADFIYYSVLGSEWATTIDRFDYKLTFENGVPDNLEVYSGGYGDEGDALNVSCKLNGNTITGTVVNIDPYNAITFYAELPEGYFSNEKTAVSKVLVILLYFVALFGCAFALYKCITVTPKKPVQTVEFYPPEGITSGEVGTIIDNSADNIDLISMIPWFAHKGYLSISEEKKILKTHTILKKLKDLPADAPTYQKTFFDGLFSSKDEVDLADLSNSFVESLTSAKKSLKDVFKGEKRLFENDFAGYALGILTTILVALTLSNDTPVKYFENSTGITISLIPIILAFIRNPSTYKRFINKKAFIFLNIVYIAVATISILFYWIYSYAGDEEVLIPYWASVIILILNKAVNFLCYRNRQPTQWNLEMTGKLMGLKEFIRTAELPRLKLLMDENPEYFYDILPYAMVFGLSDKWGKLFKDLNVKQPEWYHTNGNIMFSASHLTSTIQTSITSTITQTVAKSAAKSSGGGFSGGGGGGGGGGSW